MFETKSNGKKNQFQESVSSHEEEVFKADMHLPYFEKQEKWLEQKMEQDKKEVEKIINIQDDNEQREKCRELLDQINEDFNSSERTPEDAEMMLLRLSKLRFYTDVDQFEYNEPWEEASDSDLRFIQSLDSSWTPEMAADAVTSYEEILAPKYEEVFSKPKSYNASDIKGSKYPIIMFNFVDPYFKTENKKTVSDYFLNAVTDRIKLGYQISIPMQSEFTAFSENLGKFDPFVLRDFITAVRKNESGFSFDLLYNMYFDTVEEGGGLRFDEEYYKWKEKADVYSFSEQLSLLLFDEFEYDVEELEFRDVISFEKFEKYSDNTDNFYFLNKYAKGIINHPDLFSQDTKRAFLKENKYFLKDIEDHEEGVEYSAKYEIQKRNPSWFDSFDAESLSDEDVDFLFKTALKYNCVTFDNSLYLLFTDIEEQGDKMRFLYDIDPIMSELYPEKKDFYKNKSYYLPLNTQYGVIYDKDLEIDSFFVRTPEKESMDRTVIETERLSIVEMLEREGFSRDLMDSEEYKNLCFTYKFMMNLKMRLSIEQEFDFKLADLTVREEINFLQFISDKTVEEVAQIKEFLNQAGTEELKLSRIKSFLSLAGNEQALDDLVVLGYVVKSESADLVFSQYAKQIELIENKKKELLNIFKKEISLKPSEIFVIIENLYSHANQVLSRSVKKIEDNIKKPEKEKAEIIKKELDKLEAHLLFNASINRSLKKDLGRKDVLLENFKSFAFSMPTLEDLNPDGAVSEIVREIINDKKGLSNILISDINKFVSEYTQDQTEYIAENVKKVLQMLKIYHDNYEDKPELQEKLIQSFFKLLEKGSPDTMLYLLEKEGDVIGFCRFDDNKDGSKYFGSMNVTSSAVGFAIGDAFMQKALEEQSKEHILVADCDPETLVSSYYVEKAGFVIDTIHENYADTGLTIFGIERSEKNQEFYYRNMDRDKIIQEYEEKGNTNDYSDNEPHFILKFNRNSQELYDTAHDLVNNKGYIATRYFFTRPDPYAYIAFEKVQEEGDN